MDPKILELLAAAFGGDGNPLTLMMMSDVGGLVNQLMSVEATLAVAAEFPEEDREYQRQTFATFPIHTAAECIEGLREVRAERVGRWDAFTLELLDIVICDAEAHRAVCSAHTIPGCEGPQKDLSDHLWMQIRTIEADWDKQLAMVREQHEAYQAEIAAAPFANVDPLDVN